MGWASAKWWESNPCLEKYENILGKTESLEAHHGTSTWWPIFLLFTCNELANQVLDPLGKKSNNDVLTWKAQRRTSKSKLRLEGALKSLKKLHKNGRFLRALDTFLFGLPRKRPRPRNHGSSVLSEALEGLWVLWLQKYQPRRKLLWQALYIYIHILYIIFYIYNMLYIYIHTHISDHKWMF